MTNNLKILTILSIFVLILTGYFCFSSSFAKNQIIVNNNNEKKDSKETTIDTNNKDSNNNEEKDNAEKTSNLSILNIVILIVILIIIAVIIFIIIDFNKSKSETEVEFQKIEKSEVKEEPKVEEELEIKKGPEKDFKKDNFCPLFFLICPSLLKEKNKDIDMENVSEDGNSFFEILANCITSYRREINKIEIFLKFDNFMKFVGETLFPDKKYSTCLSWILNEINEFAAFTKNVSGLKNISKIRKPFPKIIEVDTLNTARTSIENKYGEEFDSYLCSYLLYYLIKEIAKRKIIVEIKGIKNVNDIKNTEKIEKTFFFKANENAEPIKVLKTYLINIALIDKILRELIDNNKDNDKDLNTVIYT